MYVNALLPLSSLYFKKLLLKMYLESPNKCVPLGAITKLLSDRNSKESSHGGPGGGGKSGP